MADNRKIIFGVHVSPRQSTAQEEGVERWSYDTGVNKALGSKGSLSIDTGQYHSTGDSGWTSMTHPNETWDTDDDLWGFDSTCWSDYLTVDSSGAVLSAQTDALGICYIKNVGSNSAEISLDTGSSYHIKLSAGASIVFRGDETLLTLEEVKVKSASGTNIEYIIAKKA
jgi:hypothetical protein